MLGQKQLLHHPIQTYMSSWGASRVNLILTFILERHTVTSILYIIRCFFSCIPLLRSIDEHFFRVEISNKRDPGIIGAYKHFMYIRKAFGDISIYNNDDVSSC